MRTLLLLAVLLAIATDAHAQPVRHDPPAETPPGEALQLRAVVADASRSTLVVHYRRAGSEDSWTAATFQRTSGDEWTVEVPAEAVRWPGVAYYLEGVFASAEHPHVVQMKRSARELRRERDLALAGGRSSRLRVAAQYIDYGTREVVGFGGTRDRYYRIDTDVAYRLFAYPLEQIRLGYTRLIGDVPETRLEDPAGCTSTDCSVRVGFKVGGWFELRLGLAEAVALDARGMVMATNVGFGVGGRAELRFGVEDGNHVACGVEAIQDIGTTGHFRIGWGTVPGLPMAATLEVSDMPAAWRAPGVRFVYDIARPVGGGVLIGGRLGYQARDADVGGLSIGVNTTFDF